MIPAESNDVGHDRHALVEVSPPGVTIDRSLSIFQH